MTKLRVLMKLSAAVALISAALLITPGVAHAAITAPPVPDQSQCNNGIPQFSWSSMGLAHPTLASLHVNAGFGDEAIASPAVAAGNHQLAASICATEDQGKKTDVTIYQQTSPGNTSLDLTGALTPAGHPIDANTVITVSLGDLGTRASAYTFSLIHGVVTNWAPTNLATSSAALTFSFKPTRTPIIDTVAHPEWYLCSATPPTCLATQSGIDVLSASTDMDYGAGNFTEFTGAYFGLTGAVAGFVQAQGSTINATLGGPHALADGVTPNTGSMQAFLPDSVLHDALHTTAADAASLSVTRTDGSAPTDAPFTATQVAGGAVITVSNITFSSPKYSISASGGSGGGSGDGGGTTGTPKGYVNGHGVPHQPIAGVAESDEGGYWIATNDGGIYSFGKQGFYGSMAGKPLAAPITGIASSSTGDGYYLVASDGGVFAFGDAKFLGSMGGKHLNSPIVAISATPSGAGYYLFAADGGVFAYGDATFLGSMGGKHLNSPIVSGVSMGAAGYYMVAADGGVFAYGDATFSGSAATLKLNKPIVAMFALQPGAYVLVGADGGLFSYGTDPFDSLATTKLSSPIVGVALDRNEGGFYLMSGGGDIYPVNDVPALGSLA